MKKIKFLTISLMLFFTASVYGQNDEVNSLLSTIKDKWKVENGNVIIQKVFEFENISKDNIYIALKEYLANTYGSLKEVLQVDEKENGLIICKGLYADIYCTEIFLGSATKYNFWHILKCEIKENRLRVTVQLNKIDLHTPYSSGIPSRDWNENLTDYYPIITQDLGKKWIARQGYVFYKVVNRAIGTVDAVEIFIKKNANNQRVSDDW